MSKNPFEVFAVQEHGPVEIMGCRVIVTEWSDRKFTAYASRFELGIEDTVLDSETVWDNFPTESEIESEIDSILEDRCERAHP